VIVIPSRPGVPVVSNGRDASYAVVEGDWGLSRPGAVPITVFGGSPILPKAVYTRRHSYLPKYGRVPERGRIEIEPAADRALPEPAEGPGLTTRQRSSEVNAFKRSAFRIATEVPDGSAPS